MIVPIGFARRFKVIPFNHTFEGSDRNNNMKQMLCTQENLQYICSKAMYYFSEVLKRDGFSLSQEVESETKSYLQENRIVQQFVEEIIIDGMEAIEVQAQFKEFCKDNGYTPYSPKKLKEELKNLHYEKVRATKADPNGKRPYIYTYTGKDREDILALRDYIAQLDQVNEIINNNFLNVDIDN